MKTSKARENILSKIRKALGTHKAPQPYPAAAEDVTPVYSTTELTDEENFASAFIKLGGKFVYCYNEADLVENIHVLYENFGWKQVICSDPALQNLLNKNRLHISTLADHTFPEAEVCITGCEALVGRTGSILFSSRQFMGRTAPVYYPIHIIVAYAHQVVADANHGFRLLQEKYGEQMPSMVNFNAGPSRTADIEKTLVVGVHGPAEVYCFYVDA